MSFGGRRVALESNGPGDSNLGFPLPAVKPHTSNSTAQSLSLSL